MDAVLFAVFASIFTVPVLLVTCFLFGSAWIVALANLNVSAQTALPNWVRARGLAVFLMVFFGAMSLGSVIWGHVATYASLATTLLVACFGLMIGASLTLNFKLNLGSEKNLEPSLHWPTPSVDKALSDLQDTNDLSPVLVTIRYEVQPDQHADFLRDIAILGKARRRYGAYQWGIMRDMANANHFTEYFFETSWNQHLQHHARTSGDDRLHQDTVNRYHTGDTPPFVTHLAGCK